MLNKLKRLGDIEPFPSLQSKLRYKIYNTKLRTWLIILLCLGALGIFGLYKFNQWSENWEIKWQSPIQNFIRFEPRVHAKKHFTRTAYAFEPQVPQEELKGCEKFREFVEPVFGKYTDQALFTASKESRGCTVDISDRANRNGTWDYCIFAINNEPHVRYNLDKCIQRAWEKFQASGYTWRQWYAVCPLGGTSKYPTIIKCK